MSTCPGVNLWHIDRVHDWDWDKVTGHGPPDTLPTTDILVRGLRSARV